MFQWRRRAVARAARHGSEPKRARASVRFSLGRSNNEEQVDALMKRWPARSRTCADCRQYTVPDLTISDATIAVAMSGGVDSSAVAGLLQRQGQRIVGLTMQLWNQRRLPEFAPEGGATGRCCSLDDVYDARHVAQHLGIPYYVVNFETVRRAGGAAVH